MPICCEIQPTTQKIGEKQIIKYSYYKSNIIMDVSSVAFNRNLDIPPKVENINITFYTFIELGYYVVGIADKSLRKIMIPRSNVSLGFINCFNGSPVLGFKICFWISKIIKNFNESFEKRVI